LDTWLVEHAPGAEAAGSARTYAVVDEENRVVGYYALTVASLEREEATGRASRGMPRHPIPAMLLGRLAVDESVQGEGVGAMLLADVMQRTLLVAEETGIRLLLVHVVNEDARNFYRPFATSRLPREGWRIKRPTSSVRYCSRGHFHGTIPHSRAVKRPAPIGDRRRIYIDTGADIWRFGRCCGSSPTPQPRSLLWSLSRSIPD
jgi:GNAT superfamily N-acetyltransferase